MMAMLRMRLLQFVEKRRTDGLLAACASTFYRREEAVPVERDLATLRPAKDLGDNRPQLLDLGPENVHAHALRYPLRSRQTRMELFFARGYRSLVMVRDGVVIGDVWYVSHATSSRSPRHPHLPWFGIDLGPDEVYMFDMHILAEERGNALATWFMTTCLEHMRDLGCTRAYGYFAAGNLPALWMHRVLGFKERAHVVLHRCLIFETARPKA